MDLITSDDIGQAASQSGSGAEDSSSQHPSTPAGSAGADTTVQPGADGADASIQPKGPIPFDRHEAILQNARAEYEKKYGWAKDLDPDEIRQAQAIYQHLNGNPKEFHQWLSGVLKDQLAEPAPSGPDYQDSSTGARFYSADRVQALLTQEIAKVKDELMGELEPIKGHYQTEAARGQAMGQIEEAKAWPHFDDNIAEITDYIEVTRRNTGKPVSLERAYLQVVLPKLGALERKSVVQEIKNKPGSSDVRPGQQPSAGKTSDADKSWADLLKEEAAARTTR